MYCNALIYHKHKNCKEKTHRHTYIYSHPEAKKMSDNNECQGKVFICLSAYIYE
jgi:hypothetical protein